VSDDFDIGPLAWVKDEIEKSLNTGLENLHQWRENLTDTSPLKFAKTHLYQASGAFDMVGLEGCKFFCAELEKVIAKLITNELAGSSEVVATLTEAIQSLQSYLDALMSGAGDVPLRLYDRLAPVLAIDGRELDKSALFFPDLSRAAPKELPVQELAEDAYARFVQQQRLHFQKSFLAWHQTRQAEASNRMATALREICVRQTRNQARTLWWSASVFAHAIQSLPEHELAGAKRLCRKLDQELKLVQDGHAKHNPVLLKSLLYFIAAAQSEHAEVEKARQWFDLPRLDEMLNRNAKQGVIDAQELSIAQSLLPLFDALCKTWDELSNQLDFTQHAQRQSLPIAVDTVLMTACVDKLVEHQPTLELLSQVVVVDLYKSIAQAIQFLLDNQGMITHPALIEIAAGMHLQHYALTHYNALGANSIQKLLSEIDRLERIASGERYDQLAPERSSELDVETIKAVVTHVLGSLKSAEQSLDTFFRKISDKSPLSLVHKPMKSVASVFNMLNLEVPAKIAKLSQQFVEWFEHEAFTTNQGEFELLAESLSMLGMYAEKMPKASLEYEQAMASALDRMQLAYAHLSNASQDAQKAEADALPSQQNETAQTADAVLVTDRAIDDELLDIFVIESEAVLALIAQHLQVLKVAASHESLVEVRRGFHTLKGSGRTVGLSHLGEIASKVEQFLNQVLDKQLTLTPHQLNEVEQVAVVFANWVAELRTHQHVRLALADWLARIMAWSAVARPVEAIKKPSEDVVLIGGLRKLGRQFYTVFLNESMLNITTLEQDLAKMADHPGQSPSSKARHATHTLASNALAAGFQPMGELGRVVENWLDETSKDWTPAQHKLYTRFVKSIARMWQAVSELKEPKAEKALLKAIMKATPSLNAALKRGSAPVIDTLRHQSQADTLNLSPADTLSATMPSLQINQEQASPLDTHPISGFEPPNLQDETDVGADILTLFHDEADELLPAIGSALRAWRSTPSSSEHPDALQRALHTLKGSARMAGKERLGDLVHQMEERIVQALKRPLDAPVFEQLLAHWDAISGFFEHGQLAQAMVSEPVTFDSAVTEPAMVQEVAPDVVTLIKRSLNDQSSSKLDDEVAPEQPTLPIARKSQYLRMRADTLDRLINEAGEISIIRSRIDKEVTSLKASSYDLTESVTRLRNYLRELEIEAESQLQSRLTLLQESNETFDPLEFDRFTRLQELTRMMAESVNDVVTIQHGFVTNLDQAEAALQQQTRMNRSLQQSLMGVRMLPFAQLTERLDRIVRQTARALKKQVEFTMGGEKTELDRSVLDKIGAPLEHLLRNAVAHGIETPSQRKQHKKPATGKLHLQVTAQNEEIRIEIHDDGAGVDLAKVKQVAVERGLVDPNAKKSDQQWMTVIFEPGFSTLEAVSHIAGRGVGLDVVRNEVTGLGGRIDVESQRKQGTRFTIYLPVTLSVSQVLMVQAAHQPFAISVGLIEQAQKIKSDAMTMAYVDGEIVWSGQHYPLYHLSKLLNQPVVEQAASYASVLLLRSGQYRIALHVDEVLGNQEIVIKPIGAELARVPGIMGATVTGDGRIIYILNPILLANREELAVGSVSVKVQDAIVKPEKQRILIVDDSLTMRKVLGRLFEREGYEVHVAKDGMDALQILQEFTPEAILTDIEMPRMDGFGLARNIRDDARTRQTPLIMISSRTAEKHQALAKEIGVDVFFGKPVQDEAVLASVRTLIAEKLPA